MKRYSLVPVIFALLLGSANADPAGWLLRHAKMVFDYASSLTVTCNLEVSNNLRVDGETMLGSDGTTLTAVLLGTVDINDGAASGTVTIAGFDANDYVFLEATEDVSTATWYVKREAGDFDVVLNGSDKAGSTYTLMYQVVRVD